MIEVNVLDGHRFSCGHIKKIAALPMRVHSKPNVASKEASSSKFGVRQSVVCNRCPGISRMVGKKTESVHGFNVSVL